MPHLFDLSTDWLADASLTPDQRRVWNNARRELIDLREQVQDMETRLRSLERQPPLDDTLYHTVLTRPEFNREVARMLAFDERYGGISSVLYFDIENLQDIITRHGRAVANAAIRITCDTLIKHVRSSDIVGRLASDEFGVLLARCDNPSAWKKGESMSFHLREALTKVHDCFLEPIISYGAYTFRENENIAEGLKEAAASVTNGVVGL